jgi:tetratricopeptide (TPR) repeat protein
MDGHWFLGEVYSALMEREKAREEYQKVLALDPAFAMAHLRLAAIALYTGDRKTADYHLREQRRNRPPGEAFFLEKGTSLALKGDYPAAIDSFKRALLLNDQSADALYGLGMAKLKRGQLKGALALFARVAQQTEPDKADLVLFQMGQTYMILGEPAMAEREFLASRDKAPANSAFSGLALLMAKESSRQQAVQKGRAPAGATEPDSDPGP